MDTPRHHQLGRGIIAWFVANPVAANLLMLVIIGFGITSAFTIKKAIAPDFEINTIKVTQVYPGAAPAEVESGLILKIEEAIKDVNGIKRVESVADESLGTVEIQVLDGFDVNQIMDDIKIRIDGIASFPEEAEKPVITKVDMVHQAVIVQLYGDIDQMAMKALAEQVKQELLSDPYVSRIDLWGARDYEISIEIAEAQLRKYHLTLGEVADIVRRSSVDIPGGSIRTDTGNIMVRTIGQAYNQQEFADIVLLTRPDGTRLTLGDIAHIRDGFVELKGFAAFNGLYSVALVAYAVGDQDILKVGERVKAYVAAKKTQLPDGVHIDHWADTTYYLNGRLNMMLKNLLLGGFLVFLVLGLFMELEVAFWVMVGLPVCFLGAFAMMPAVDVSVNMISLFGFILVLGIVVDDAIIIGESVHSTTAHQGHSHKAVVEGAKRVALPATFGVLTTIMAFSPNLFISGVYANFPKAFGWVVTFCLLFSLIESKWILPAHLAETRTSFWRTLLHWRWQDRLQTRCNTRLHRFVQDTYRPFLHRCIARRYTTAAAFLATLIVSMGLIAGGVVRYIMAPQVENDFIMAEIEMTEGTPESVTLAAIRTLNESLRRVEARYREDTGSDTGFIKHNYSFGQGGTYGMTMIELVRHEHRDIDSREIVQRWRDAVGEIPGTRVLSITSADEAGPPIAYVLSSYQPEDLAPAANELVNKLRGFAGVYDIRNSASDLVEEVHLNIKPAAEALGLTQADLGTQVRQAFYGAEAQRIQRGTDEVKVMVRYPRSERRSITHLESMYIRTADGTEVPFSTVAELDVKPGHSKITRINSQRSVLITADVDEAVVEPSRVMQQLDTQFFPELEKRYPGLSKKLDASALESKKMENQLFTGFSLALFGIFALLAIPLRSYLQPLIIMSVIPFGVIGAIIGHWVMGLTISMMSIFGIIALAGVVVNDSLIMVDFVNRARERGQALRDAVVGAGTERFRAILLTSMTTFFGLVPMLLETSVQAQFVIPMAVSLAFGILFATCITLILVPCLYIMLDDLKRLFGAGATAGH